ncbi:MAG: DUF6122 family protein [bacterium]|nr:DUF6122 family protein [bacterium]
MTTPTHVAVNLGVFLALMQVPAIEPNYTDLALMLSSNLIDLDHLLSRPIYHPKRNPFKTHFLHKQWRGLLVLSILMLFVRPVAFLGIGLLLHFFLDYLYTKREKV